MENRKKIWRWVLLYLVIIVTFLLFDLLFLDGAFRRDLMASFVQEGMDQVEALRILGAPEYMLGLISKFALPFGKRLYLSVYEVVLGVNPDDYFLRGAYLPIIMAAVAGLEAVWYLLRTHRAKRKEALTACNIEGNTL